MVKVVDDMTPAEEAALAKYASLPNLPSIGPNVIEVTSGSMSNRDFLVAATVLAQEKGIDTALRTAASGPSQGGPGVSGPKTGPSNNS